MILSCVFNLCKQYFPSLFSLVVELSVSENVTTFDPFWKRKIFEDHFIWNIVLIFLLKSMSHEANWLSGHLSTQIRQGIVYMYFIVFFYSIKDILWLSPHPTWNSCKKDYETNNFGENLRYHYGVHSARK